MANMLVGERIKELRELQHYTREELAERVNISSKFLYEIERGRKGFSAAVLCRISEELSVSCDYIMMGKENKYSNKDGLISALEMFSPRQISKIQDILQILYDICERR